MIDINQDNEENKDEQSQKEESKPLHPKDKADSTDEIVIFETEQKEIDKLFKEKDKKSEKTIELNEDSKNVDSQNVNFSHSMTDEDENFNIDDMFSEKDSLENAILSEDFEDLGVLEKHELLSEFTGESLEPIIEIANDTNFESNEYLQSIIDAELKFKEHKNEIKTIKQGKNKIIVFTESFGYACQICGTDVSKSAKICKNCGIEFTYVMCENCGFTGSTKEFTNHTCPDCNAKPIEIPEEFPELRKCPKCKQLLREGDFYCHYCSWKDFGALTWFLSSIVLFLGFLPLITTFLDGFNAELIFVSSLSIGGLLLWNFGQILLKIYDKPKRFNFYWFISLIAGFLLFLLKN